MINWQESMVDELRSRLEPNQDLLGLLLFGSCSKPEWTHDPWSDVDVLVVVKNNAMDTFFPTVAWIAVFGDLYSYAQSSDEFKSTTRVCFENFNRIDFVITTEEKLARVNDWPSVPFFSGTRILISRSTVVDEIARQRLYPHQFEPATEDRFLDLVREFRFKSMQAIYKVVRHDLLIALHLTQDLIRDCCVLEMMLRDRETGTNIHRHGGIGNPFVAELEVTQKPFTAIGILDSIAASNEVFENLACEWSTDYQEKRHLLQAWIEKAKLETLSEGK
jgi:predicted nucleotidyltransferase